MTLHSIYSQYGLMVRQRQLAQCIPWLEDGLRSIRTGPFHQVLGKHFLPHTQELADTLIALHEDASRTRVPAAVYVEMNEFDINPDLWFVNGFAYKAAGSIWEGDWLAFPDWGPTGELVLSGMEEVQAAFAENPGELNRPLGLRVSQALAELLVCVRMMEVVKAATESAAAAYAPLHNFPVLAAVHEGDDIYQASGTTLW